MIDESSGKCKVEETPKGWFLTLIQKDPEEQMRDKMKEKRKRADEADEIRHARELQKQVERAKKLAKPSDVEESHVPSDLRREEMGGKVLGFDLNLRTSSKAGSSSQGQLSKVTNLFGDSDDNPGTSSTSGIAKGAAVKGSNTTLGKMMEEQEAEKEKKKMHNQQQQQEQSSFKCWLAEGIVVKIMSKALKGDGFYKEKARVRKVVSQGGRFLGEIEHLKTGAVLRVDQADLETVIPKEGGSVLVLAGQYKGQQAILLKIDTKSFQAQVELAASKSTGPLDKRKVWLEYDDISKYRSP